MLFSALSYTLLSIQWTYVCGNNWGVCDDGTGALGCGAQEHFRACSDIRIEGEPDNSINEIEDIDT